MRAIFTLCLEPGEAFEFIRQIRRLVTRACLWFTATIETRKSNDPYIEDAAMALAFFKWNFVGNLRGLVAEESVHIPDVESNDSY